MNKFQKILSIGLALTQLCSVGCVLGTSCVHANKTPNISATTPAKQKPGIASTICKCFGHTALALFVADSCLQIGCFKSPSFAKAWAAQIDSGLSRVIRSDVSLRQLNTFISIADFSAAATYFENYLKPIELEEGLPRAIKLTSLGLTEYICASAYSYDPKTCATAPDNRLHYYFLPTGNALSINLNDRSSLPVLLTLCETLKATHKHNDNKDLATLISQLRSTLTLARCSGAPAAIRSKLSAAATGTWDAIKAPFTRSSTTPRNDEIPLDPAPNGQP